MGLSLKGQRSQISQPGIQSLLSYKFGEKINCSININTWDHSLTSSASPSTPFKNAVERSLVNVTKDAKAFMRFISTNASNNNHHFIGITHLYLRSSVPNS